MQTRQARIALVLLVLPWLTGQSLFAAGTQPPGTEESANTGVEAPSLPDRAPPVRDFAVERTLSVAEFGAVPDDGTDDLSAVREAMAEAMRTTEPLALVFPKGTYDLMLPESPEEDLIFQVTHDALALYRAEDLILDGRGSTILIHDPTMGFLSLLACRRVIVRNFHVDWVVPPFAQGFVAGIAADQGWFEFRQTPGFLSLDSPVWQEPNRKGYDQIRWGMLKDRRVPGRMKAGVVNVTFVDRWEKTGEDRYRMFVQSHEHLRDDFEAGDPFVYVDRNGGGLCVFTQCEQLVIQGVTCHTSPGLNFGGAHCSDVAILDCRVLLKPGWWHTSNADGMHFSQFRVGPWVENCVFEGMADDGANLYAHPTHVRTIQSDREFETEPTVDWRPGDTVLGFEPKEGRVLGTARVLTADLDRTRGITRLVLDAPIPGLQASETRDKGVSYLLNLDLSSSNFVFRDNTFRNLRRFGILMQSHDGLVEGNVFDGVSASSIVVRNSAGWPEGFPTGNILVRGNTVRNGNFDHNVHGLNAADITVSVNRLDGQNAVSRAISRVEISHNTVENTRRRAISVASASDVRIIGNRIVCDSTDASMTPDPFITPVRLRDVDRVEVSGNSVRDPRPLAPDTVTLEGRCSGVHIE